MIDIHTSTSNTSEISTVSGTAYFCIAHVEPLFRLPHYFNLIKTQDFVSSHTGNSFSLRSYLINQKITPKNNENLSEYTYRFLISILSQRMQSKISRVSISSHRKIIVKARIGRTSKTYLPGYQGMNVIRAEELSTDDLFVPLDTQVLVMPPVVFSGKVIGQYSKAHSLDDFLLSLILCKKVGILNDSQVLSFISQEIFFPCLLLGTFPLGIFLEIGKLLDEYLSASERSAIGNSHAPNSYQSRARSFFAERLASYLFAQRSQDMSLFTTNGNGILTANPQAFGYCLTVVPNDYSGDYLIG